MILYIVGLGLIVVGALIYMFLLKDGGAKKADNKDAAADPSKPDELTDEQKEELAKK